MGRILIAVAIALLAIAAPDLSNNRGVLAAPVEPGVQLFQTHCAGCHPRGGNIIRRGKTLKLKALHRNGLDSPEEIAILVKKGKNNMSAFEERLSSEEIEAVSAYVWERSQQGWR